MISWVYMVLAILTEVGGTLAMKHTADGNDNIYGFGIMYIMLIFSYTFLALAIKKIPMTVAYGAWESLGVVIISVLSAYLYSEALTLNKVIAICLLILGILLLEHGTKSTD